MKHKRTLLSSAFMLSISLGGIYAQEAVTTTGGEAFGSGGSVSYTIGQVNYITSTGVDGTVAQGVQQAYEISVAVGIHENSGINLGLTAFPNPTTNYLTLEIENYASENLSFQLYDLNGKILKEAEISENATTIDMVSYYPGSYFLKVLDSQTEVKTFKIIKH